MLAIISFSTIFFSTLVLYATASVLILNQGIAKLKKQEKGTNNEIEIGVSDDEMNENAKKILSTKNVSQLLQKEKEARVPILDILNEGRKKYNEEEILEQPKYEVSDQNKRPKRDFTEIFKDLKNKSNHSQ